MQLVRKDATFSGHHSAPTTTGVLRTYSSAVGMGSSVEQGTLAKNVLSY